MIPNHLVSELIRALRGRRSQAALSRRLGYTTNVLYGWESGRRSPSAVDFFRMVRLGGGSPAQLCRRFFRAGSAWAGPQSSEDSTLTQALVRELVEGRNRAEVARRSGCSRTTLLAWIAGSTPPRLGQLLRLVDATALRLLDFVALFVDPAHLPSLRRPHADLLAQREVAYELPWSHAILRTLEVEGAEQDATALAARLGIPVLEVEKCLRALVRARQIRRRHGHWQLVRVLAVDTRDDPERNRSLKAHWSRVALARLERRPPVGSAVFSYNLFSVSQRDYQRIRALQLRFYEDVRSLVEKSVPTERVALLNVQLVPLDE
jgi:transcriptional regulator with XRE-family HTH domain